MANDESVVRIPVDALLARGRRALEQGDIGAAEAAFTEAAERRPDAPEAHVGLARVALSAGRPGDALRHLPRAVQTAPGQLEAYELFAFLGFHGGVADTAITWLEHGTRFLPREPRLFEFLVRLYAAEGRTEDLRECLAHYGRLRGISVRQAALVFTRDASVPEDLKSRIAIAAGF